MSIRGINVQPGQFKTIATGAVKDVFKAIPTELKYFGTAATGAVTGAATGFAAGVTGMIFISIIALVILSCCVILLISTIAMSPAYINKVAYCKEPESFKNTKRRKNEAFSIVNFRPKMYKPYY